MKSARDQEHASFRSIDEFRRAFLPGAYERQLQEARTAGPTASGTGLAPALLKSIKGQLAKRPR